MPAEKPMDMRLRGVYEGVVGRMEKDLKAGKYPSVNGAFLNALRTALADEEAQAAASVPSVVTFEFVHARPPEDAK